MSMGVTMELNKMDMARLMGLLVRFPKETYRGIGRAASIVRGRLRKIMKNEGGEGVGDFKTMSEITAAVKGRTKLGGALAKASAIQMWKESKSLIHIGFVSGLVPWAKAFQEAETRPFGTSEKKRFYKFGVKTLPAQYDRPARNMIEPFAKSYEKEFLRWAIANTEKILSGVRA